MVQRRNPRSPRLRTPFCEGLVSPVLNSAEELPAVQAGREAVSIRCCSTRLAPVQAVPKPLMLSPELHELSKKQPPSPSKPLGRCFWARGVSEHPPSRNEQGRGFARAAETPGAGGRGLPTSPQKHIYSKDSKRGSTVARALPARLASFSSQANHLAGMRTPCRSAEQRSRRGRGVSGAHMGSAMGWGGQRLNPTAAEEALGKVLEKDRGNLGVVPSPAKGSPGTLRKNSAPREMRGEIGGDFP